MLATDFWIDVAPIIVIATVSVVLLVSAAAIVAGSVWMYRMLRDERRALEDVHAADQAAVEETLAAVLTDLRPVETPACVTPIYAAPSFGRRGSHPRGVA